jgi:squalene-hopene/tetraprenyl-beta-curcumene cyclase
MLSGWIACWVIAVIPPATNGEAPAWNPQQAAHYLDSRCQTWFEFERGHRGQGASSTSCISCHTALPYCLGRPALQKLMQDSRANELEQKMLVHTAMRVNNWAKLDMPAFQLYYDSSDTKKKESRGTEAILYAVILSLHDRDLKLSSPSPVTKKAFTNLWELQIADGNRRGSWDWLNFGTEPWESEVAGYHGAALAAIATGTCPGYYSKGTDAALDAKVTLLTSFLKENLAKQNLFNRLWALWASSALEGVLETKDREQIVADLFAKQRDDGGWSLSSLGSYSRKDSSKEETGSDGYATGLILHALQCSGIQKSEPRVAKGLAWLSTNQKPDGSWGASSLNKKRDPETHIGKFMSDAATGFAVLALSH